MAKYINPYTDFGFKKLFGEEANKDLLIDFLNQLLPAHHQIADLTFRNPESLADLSIERKAIFDIHCKAVSGERFIVEMQKAKLKYFKDRSLFYVTFPIRDQAQQGDWNFRLDAIYFVAILDFEYDEAEEKRKFRRDVALKDQDGDLFFDKLHFRFLQMPLFKKTESELETKFDKWCYFLKHLESFDHIPSILNEPIFQKAFEIAALASLTPEQRDRYEESLLQYRDLKSVLETAVEEKVLEIVKKLIKRNLTNEEIAEDTGLSVEQIEQLRREVNRK
ncbi:MAG: Rpn family recombination-promoting nuclease/putative transposase [Raineya sp.]|nr:Rpn family recombination-promoting nuclease/putative transposase [Raineya sp.]MDW8297612.1 Rpn family recombination-promoting nuclease/putative transposase [Raineya sp.]